MLSFYCNTSSDSISDIIQNISLGGISKEIIRLYLTKEGFDADNDNNKYFQEPPDNEDIEKIIACVKKDVFLLLLRKAFDTLVNYTQQEMHSNKLDVKLLRKAKQALYINNINEFQNLFIDYLDSNDYLTDLNYSTINQFFEDFNERFEMEIPEICCSRYFDTLHDNLERYIKTSNKEEFRLILNPNKGLEAIDAIEMPDIGSKNFSKLEKELLQMKQYMLYIMNSHSDKININKSFVLYLYNNECRLIDILFMAFCSYRYGYCEYYTEDSKSYSPYRKKIKHLVNGLENLIPSLIDKDKLERMQQLISDMISSLDKYSTKTYINNMDFFCTKIALMGHWASNDFMSPYNNNKLLNEILFPSIIEYVLQIYKKNTGICNDIELYINIYDELKHLEMLMDYFSDAVTIINGANADFFKDYFYIRQSIYIDHYFKSRKSHKNSKV